LLRDENTIGDYYKAWDKINIDEQLENSDEEYNSK